MYVAIFDDDILKNSGWLNLLWPHQHKAVNAKLSSSWSHNLFTFENYYLKLKADYLLTD